MPTLYCYDHITAQLCPEAHCDPRDGQPEAAHDPAVVDLEHMPEAVSVYHGRALCLACLAKYMDAH